MIMDTSSKGTSITSDDNANMYLNNLAEVDQDESYFTFLEDEVTGMQHFVVEPDFNRGFLDDTIDSETFNSRKGFDTQYFSCAFEYDQIKFDTDALDLFLTKVEEIKKQGELVNDLNLLQCDKTFKVSEGKATILSSTASFGSSPDSMDILDNQHLSQEKHVKREKIAGSDSLQSLSSLVTEVGFFSMDKTNTVDSLVKQKRVHRSPGRFIEGPEKKSRHHYGKCGACSNNSRDNFLHVRSHKQHCQKGIGNAQFDCQEDSFKGYSIQVSIDLPVQKGRSKENTPFSGYDSRDCKESGVSVSNEDFDIEPSSTDSQDDISVDDSVTRSNIQRGRKRKRCHRRWTSAEVMKLIEGVSQCGVGKWTRIKRLLFSSSSHRTSVNLKDKWRNLLKASNQMQRKGKVEQGPIQSSNKLPESILRQVRKLAVIYSCARESGINVSCNSASCNAPVASFPGYHC